MEFPWYLQPHWVQHANMVDAQSSLEYQFQKAVQSKDDAILLLQQRISALEVELLAVEKLLAERGITAPMLQVLLEEEARRTQQEESRSQPAGTPVHFAARTSETIECPHCGKRQRGDRDACYSCGTPFLYDHE